MPLRKENGSYPQGEQSVIDNLVFMFYLVLIAIYPLYDGSRTVVLYVLLACAVQLMLFVWVVWNLRRMRHAPSPVRRNRIVLILLFAWLFFVFLQVLPLLQGEQAVGFRLQGRLPGFVLENRFPLSRNGLETYRHLVLYSSYVSLFLLTLLLVRSWYRVWILVAVLLTVGLFEAFFGMANYAAGKPVFGWAPIHWSFHMATGTYKNKNHFANLLMLAAAVPVGVALSLFAQSVKNRGGKFRLGSILERLLSIQSLLVLLILPLAAAVLLSRSRGVILAAGVATVVVIVLHLAKHRTLGGLVLPGILALGALLIFGGGDLLQRFALLSEQGGSRLEQWSLSLAMLGESPVVGIGAGAYGSVFPAYKIPTLPPLRYDHAHNDYLELVIEQGMVGFLLAAVMMVLVVTKIGKSYFSSRSWRRQGVLLGCLFGIVAMLTHAAVDYPFQIPANAAWFFVLCALGLAAIGLESPRKETEFGKSLRG